MRRGGKDLVNSGAAWCTGSTLAAMIVCLIHAEDLFPLTMLGFLYGCWLILKGVYIG